jgi:hypothetical protein
MLASERVGHRRGPCRGSSCWCVYPPDGTPPPQRCLHVAIQAEIKGGPRLPAGIWPSLVSQDILLGPIGSVNNKDLRPGYFGHASGAGTTTLDLSMTSCRKGLLPRPIYHCHQSRLTAARVHFEGSHVS